MKRNIRINLGQNPTGFRSTVYMSTGNRSKCYTSTGNFLKACFELSKKFFIYTVILLRISYIRSKLVTISIKVPWVTNYSKLNLNLSYFVICRVKV